MKANPSGSVRSRVRGAQSAEGYAQLKSIDLQEQVSVTPPVIVKADRLALVEAVLNLIGNAIKYSPIGSTILVSVSIEGNQAVCTVRDRGPGIRPEERSKLFTIGGVHGSKPTPGEPQTGIGLAMTFELIRAKGGTLWCDSEPANGATFGIRLSLAGAASDGERLRGSVSVGLGVIRTCASSRRA